MLASRSLLPWRGTDFTPISPLPACSTHLHSATHRAMGEALLGGWLIKVSAHKVEAAGKPCAMAAQRAQRMQAAVAMPAGEEGHLLATVQPRGPRAFSATLPSRTAVHLC